MKFIRTSRFKKDMMRLGATVQEIDAVEHEIAAHPEAGDVIKGLNGIRKIRFRLGKKGKRGGGRAIYVLLVGNDAVVMLMAYSKNEQSDLTTAQRKAITQVLGGLNEEQ